MSSRPRILIVDDEKDVRWALRALVRDEGMTPLEAQNGVEALEHIRAESPEVVLLDIKLPDMDGMQVLREVRRSDLTTPIIVVTAYGTVELAVQAVKAGAYDFITKPFDNDRIVLTVRRALREHALVEEVQRLHSQESLGHPLCRTMGPSGHVARLAEQVDRVADTNLSVLISGESGSGKELVAHAIHERSSRASSRFVPVDCGSLPASLVENELFGHQEGAFTGAGRARAGKFESASGGTLFLDEIGNLPFSAQGAILRALQEKTVCRVGGVEQIPVDVRVVVATNRDIHSLISAEDFRADLYHRLAEFELHVAPLRDRKEDLPFLAKRFLDEANVETGRHAQRLSEQAWYLLLAYKWPGNVRELRNVIRRAVVVADTVIEPRHLPALKRPMGIEPMSIQVSDRIEDNLSLKEITRRTVREVERQVLTKVLKHTGGNKARAARILQVDYKTVHTKVKRYGIEL